MGVLCIQYRTGSLSGYINVLDIFWLRKELTTGKIVSLKSSAFDICFVVKLT